jgi:outer membrane protein OmpA-like peptidoglycan-associated protein
MKSNTARRWRCLAAFVFVVAVSACAEEPPAPVLARYPALTPPRPLAKPFERRASAAQQSGASRMMAPIGPGGPSGPLVAARVGSYMDALESDLRRHVHGKGISVVRIGDDIAVVVRNDRLFAASGTLGGDDVLEPLGAILDGYVHTAVWVNGFTDTAGTPDTNLAISQKRARTIADALVHEGVAAQRITAQGFGEDHLRIATGDGKKEPRNRRIEIVLKANPERTTATR